MFRIFLTALALLAVSTTSVNRLAYPSELTSSAGTLKSTKSTKKKGCVPCFAGLAGDADSSPLEELATLGRSAGVQPLMPLQRSIFDGTSVNFVSTATGQLSFAVTDLELTGALPLMFQRVYSSDRSEDTGLGAGWSFILDNRITIDADKALMRAGNGAQILFRRDAGSGHFHL